jgi:aspartyl-tRNA(Asn)/glutamyl-tRNA(Gln) amidotransferase subunit A
LSRASEGIRDRAAAAARLSSDDVESARIACARLRRNVAQGLKAADADAIVTPTWPFPAPRIAEQNVIVKGVSVPVDPHRNCFVRAANAIDACAISVPMGLYRSASVPAGLHLMAEGGSEARLLATAGLIEAALPPLPLAPPLQSL